PSGRARVAPAALSIPSDRSATVLFTLENHGTREAAFDVHAYADLDDEPEDLPWVRIQPDSGTVPPGGRQTFAVTADRSRLSPGSYQGQVVIWTDTPETGS